MATSGSWDFNATCNEIIEMAAKRAGIIGIDQTPDASFYGFWRRVLNAMNKNWASKGQRLWDMEWITLPLTASSVVLGPDSLDHEAIKSHTSSSDSSDKPITGSVYSSNWKALTTAAGSAWAASTDYTAIGHLLLSSNTNIIDIEQGRLKEISAETTVPLTKIGRDDWFNVSYQPSSGTPSRFYFRRKTTPEIFLDPFPDSATKWVLEFLVYTLPEDFDAAGDNPDFLSEWIDPLVEGLMVKMGPSAGIFGGKLDDFRKGRDEALDNAEALDHEMGGFSVAPKFGR